MIQHFQFCQNPVNRVMNFIVRDTGVDIVVSVLTVCGKHGVDTVRQPLFLADILKQS